MQTATDLKIGMISPAEGAQADSASTHITAICFERFQRRFRIALLPNADAGVEDENEHDHERLHKGDGVQLLEAKSFPLFTKLLVLFKDCDDERRSMA